MGMNTIAVIDGDIIAYRAAAANETRSIVATHKATGKATPHPHRTAFRAHIKGLFEEDEFVVEDVQEPEELSHALHSINVTLKNIMEACDAVKAELYISGPTNFRDNLPLPSKYKGQRADLMRPLQLKACRQYLVQHYGAVAAEGCEADDMLSMRTHAGLKTKQQIIQVSLDKDSYGVEGWLYDWTKMEAPELIRGLGGLWLTADKKLKGKGRKWFYAQWVNGDSADGYYPRELSGKRWGDMSTYKLLNDCKTDTECIQAVHKQYETWYPAPVSYKAWDGTEHTKDAVAIMQMYADACHMRRFENDRLDVPAMIAKHVKGE